MSKGLERYKAFIDGLAARKDAVETAWIRGNGYPQIDDNREINQFLGSLTPEQKEIVAGMVQSARISGMHDTLAYINERMDCDGLALSQEGDDYPYDHFDSMHFDFICRCEGDEWAE